MKYYLETNSLRILSNSLNEYSNLAFTSAYSMLELIASIDRDFAVRKKVVENVFKNISIDWKLPEQYINESFKVIQFIENRISDLKRLCEILIISDTYEEYLLKLNRSKLEHDLNYFKELKQSISKNFIETTNIGNTKIKDIIREGGYYPELKLADNRNPTKKEILDFIQIENKNYNEGMTLFAIVKNIAKTISKGEIDHDEAKEIYESHDSSIHFFIEAFSYYCIMKMNQGGLPDRNDPHDLYHLVYLKNDPNLFIVTNDNLLLNLNSQLWTDKDMVVKTSEFSKIVNPGCS